MTKIQMIQTISISAIAIPVSDFYACCGRRAMGLGLGAVYPGDNIFADFFGGKPEKVLRLHQFKMPVRPGNAVFLDNIFDMFVFAAQGLDFNREGDIFPKSDRQQQQVFDQPAGCGSGGDDRNNDNIAVVFTPFADVDVSPAHNDLFGSLQGPVFLRPRWLFAG